MYPDRRVHLGFEFPVRVGQFQAQVHRPCGYVQHVADVRDLPMEDFAGIRRHQHLHELVHARLIGARIGPYEGDVFFRDVGQHPHFREISDRKELLRDLDDLSLGQIARDHPTVEWSGDGHIGHNFLLTVEFGDLFVAHAQQAQAVFGFAFLRAQAEHFTLTPLGLGKPDHLFPEQHRRTLGRPFRDVELCDGFEIRRLRHAELAAVQYGQEIAGFDLLTEIGVDVEDAASHERRNVGGRMAVRYHGSGKIPMQLELAAHGRLDHDGAAPYLFGGQRHDAGLVRLSGGLRCR